MGRIIFGLVFAAMLLTTRSEASADAVSAQTCRSQLSSVGRVMFDATAPHVRADSKIADVMRRHIRPLVLSGRISPVDAQANAQSVGRCLLELQH